MIRKILPLVLFAIAPLNVVHADAPSVAADIAPVHSLVSRVMQGLGSPDLMVSHGASPHGYTLRPSEAEALQNADLVFWVSPGLTPWLEEQIETLANDAVSLVLMGTPGTVELDIREGALFESDDHGHGHEEDSAEQEHHEEHEDEIAESDHKDGHGHAHGANDPHGWLAPENARVWIDAIAAALSEADPENADAYSANAQQASSEIDSLVSEVNKMLEPVRGRNFIVFHDAYQYFENSFDFAAAGAISVGDATKPSPARVEEIRDRVSAGGVTCVLAEPQFNPNLVATVVEGTQAKSGVLDPHGSDIALGPDLYPRLISNLARTLADCL